MDIRQSTLASYTRCPRQSKLSQVLRGSGQRERNLSATAFGTVMHHAGQILESLNHEGRKDACAVAVSTFEHYWHPDNIGELVPGGVDVWLPRQTYGGLMIRGRENLRTYYEYLAKDRDPLLALELHFRVPLPIPGGHTASGTVDRLALRYDAGKRPYLSVEDFKTGIKPNFLRHAFQWTYYAWASTQPGFWSAWPEEDLADLVEALNGRGLALYDDGSGLPIIPRRGRWIALRDTFKVHDCGWRTPTDFARMKIALAEYVDAVKADVYPLNIKGDVCTYCPFAYDGSCAGIPITSDDEGHPYTPEAL